MCLHFCDFRLAWSFFENISSRRLFLCATILASIWHFFLPLSTVQHTDLVKYAILAIQSPQKYGQIWLYIEQKLHWHRQSSFSAWATVKDWKRYCCWKNMRMIVKKVVCVFVCFDSLAICLIFIKYDCIETSYTAPTTAPLPRCARLAALPRTSH